MSSSVGRRYARAAVDAALEINDAEVEKLAAGLRAFTDAYHTSDALRELVANPGLRDNREGGLQKVLEKLGIGSVGARVLALLAEKERMGALDDVTHQVERIADERAGRLRAKVRSAVALTDKQQNALREVLEKRFGSSVSIAVSIEPELIGGMVCEVGDFTLDSSIRRQFEILRERLTANV